MSLLLLLSLIILPVRCAVADLTSVPNLTAVQARAAAATQTIFDQLGAAGGDAGTLPAEQQALFESARELVHTANEQQGNGPTAFSLGLGEDGLRFALQWVAHEELSTQGTLATDTISGQTRNLAARMTALRMGASGVNVSGLHLYFDKKSFSADALGLFNVGDTRGGAAGGDANSLGGKLGVFINGSIGFGNKDGTELEDAFDFDTYDITGGVDYRLSDSLVLGGAFGYADIKSDFDSSASIVDGSVDANSYTFSLYGTYYIKDFYIDGVVTYGNTDHDIVRRIKYPSNNILIPGVNETALGDTDSNRVSLSVNAGYQVYTGPFTLGPYLRLDSMHMDIDGYSERGAKEFNLQISSQHVTSLTTVIGLQGSMAWSQPVGVLIPQAWLDWHHEFRDDGRSISARFASDPSSNFFGIPTEGPDRNFFTMGVGISGVFRGGVQAFLNYQTVIALQDISNHLFTGGLRLEF